MRLLRVSMRIATRSTVRIANRGRTPHQLTRPSEDRVSTTSSIRFDAGRRTQGPSLLVIPPGSVRERPHVDFVSPRRSVLLREMEVGLGDLFWEQEPVVFHAARFA